MTLPRAALPLFSLALGACAGIPGLAPSRVPARQSESEYTSLPLSKAIEPSRSGKRVRFIARFGALEETVLDLPESYVDWARISVSEPDNPAAATKNIVSPKESRRFLSTLKPGELIEVYAYMLPGEADPDFGAAAAQAPLLRVDKILRAPQGSPAAASKARAADALYENRRHAEDSFRLRADGTFHLRQRGQDVDGTYELDADALTLRLPGGRIGKATLHGTTMTDPDGMEWSRSLAEPPSK